MDGRWTEFKAQTSINQSKSNLKTYLGNNVTILLAGCILYPPLVSLLELQLEAGKDLELSSLAPLPGCWGPVLLQQCTVGHNVQRAISGQKPS